MNIFYLNVEVLQIFHYVYLNFILKNLIIVVLLVLYGSLKYVQDFTLSLIIFLFKNAKTMGSVLTGLDLTKYNQQKQTSNEL